MGFNENIQALFCSSSWHVENVVIGQNPNGSREIMLGYRDGDSDRVRIYTYWLGWHDFVCLKADDFLGMTEFVGIRIDNLGWPPASVFG